MYRAFIAVNAAFSSMHSGKEGTFIAHQKQETRLANLQMRQIFQIPGLEKIGFHDIQPPEARI